MTRGPAARIILTVVFAALIISPLIIKRLALRRSDAKLDMKGALARHGFYF